MNEQTRSAVPVWYWVVSIVALIWNLMGCATFAMEMFAQDSMMETWTPEQREWAKSIPGWIYVVFGAAVATGVAGSLGLLTRKAWSIPMFAISMAAVIVQMIYTMLVAGGLQVMGPSAAVMPSIVIILAAVCLWFALSSKSKGWFAS